MITNKGKNIFQEVKEIKALKEILLRHGIEIFGVMDFSKIPQLINCRAKERIPPNAKSVIVCAFPYYVGDCPERNVCRYAMLPDYHRVVGEILKQVIDELDNDYSYAAFVDNSPLPELACAVEAGLGVRGKNNLLITKEYGSYVFLGEIVTDMQLEYSQPERGSCMGCKKCLTACPSAALSEDGFNAERCISSITQRRGELKEEDAEILAKAGRAWGCDSCQDACPHNKNAKKTSFKAFLSDIEPIVTLENLDRLLETRAFGYRGRAVMERNIKATTHLPLK